MLFINIGYTKAIVLSVKLIFGRLKNVIDTSVLTPLSISLLIIHKKHTILNIFVFKHWRYEEMNVFAL